MSKYAHTYREYTYKELCMMASIYYNALKTKGVPPGRAIAMCIERYGVGPHDA